MEIEWIDTITEYSNILEQMLFMFIEKLSIERKELSATSRDTKRLILEKY
jgi:hypothetical protein